MESLFAHYGQGAALIYLARPGEVPESEAADREVRAIHRLAALAGRHGSPRIVYASSAAVYGAASTSRPFRETDATPADSAYGRLKLRSEQAVAAGGEASGVPVDVLRIFNVFGPGFSDSLVNRLIEGEEPPLVLRSAAFVRDYIYSSDVAWIVARALTRGSHPSSVLNVGTGIGTSNLDLIEAADPARYRIDQREVVSVSIADTTLLREALAFQPRVTVQDAFRDPSVLAG